MTFLKLIRYKNLLMVLLTIILVEYALIDSYFEDHFFSPLLFSLVCLSILCLTAGGYIINDVLDIQGDQINKPDKTYIGNKISLKKALIFYRILTFTGITSCVYILIVKGLSFYYLWTYLFMVFLLYLYSKTLKKLPLIGNVAIALFCAGIIVIVYTLDFEDAVLKKYQKTEIDIMFKHMALFTAILFYAWFSFITTLIREIIKDIEDIDGDYQMKMKTMPIVLGIKRSRNIAIGFSLFLIVMLLFALRIILEEDGFRVISLYVMILLLLPSLFFTYKLWYAKKKKDFHFLSNLMKIMMLLGILSMILFKFM